MTDFRYWSHHRQLPGNRGTSLQQVLRERRGQVKRLEEVASLLIAKDMALEEFVI